MDNRPKFSILIVDDETSNLDVLTHILMDDYTVFVAKNGPAALKKAHSEKPDLILLDILMPDMDGFEVLRRLKDAYETMDIPVICITGLNRVEDEEQGFFLGAVDYITKPFHESIVAARVRTQMENIKHIRIIERLGMIDALTYLPNQRCFDGQLISEWGRAVREMTSVSLLMISIDDYPAFIKTHGYPQGDVLVQSVSNIIEHTLKRPTDLAARLKNGNFAVLLPGTGLDGACALAEEIRDYVEFTDVSPEGAAAATATVSIGVAATVPYLESPVDDFIHTVERQLNLAIREGGNRVRGVDVVNGV